MAISGIQAHVKRIIQPGHLADDGSPLCFVDLLRVDFFFLETGSGPDYQRYGVTLQWRDEGSTEGINHNLTRGSSMARLTLGDGTSVYDQNTFVDFPIVDFYSRLEGNGQTVGASFDNDPESPYRVWYSELPPPNPDSDTPNYGIINSAVCTPDIEARLNAGENVPADEYKTANSDGAQQIGVDYLLFFITKIEGQMIGNLMPIPDMVKNLDHSTGF